MSRLSHCDYRRCKRKAYVEAYPKRTPTWPHLCKKHFEQEKKNLKFWSFVDENLIYDNFLSVIEKIEK